MYIKNLTVCLSIVLLMIFSGCTGPKVPEQVTEIKRFPLTAVDDVITKEGLEIDKNITSDGNGSLRIEADGKRTIPLLEVDKLGLENETLIYQAKIRTEGRTVFAYLDMMVGVTGVSEGEYKSSGSERPVAGTTDWTIAESLFMFMKGQRSSHVKLNLVVKGKGTVWIDEIRLLKAES